MGTKKVVLDTNILISAVGWDGNPKKIFQKVVNGELELVISHKQLLELKRVLDYPRLGFSENQKARFLTIVYEIATLVRTSGKLKVVVDDPDDNIILETAVEHGVEYVVSGDPHLKNLKEYGNVKIVNPAQFLELIY